MGNTHTESPEGVATQSGDEDEGGDLMGTIAVSTVSFSKHLLVPSG